MKTPDPKKHLIISLIKSGFRVWAGIVLLLNNNMAIPVAGMLIIIAETLGIAEELF